MGDAITLGLPSARTIRAKLLSDGEHYDELVTRAIARATVSVWISTANLKTMLVEAPIGTRARARGRFISFFESLGALVRRGVDVRILHASPPSRPLAQEMARMGATSDRTRGIELRRCPRVHLKMIAIDGSLLYLGSANLTGAGLGAKGEGRRNFEMGIVTDSEQMLDVSQERFDRIWRGAECKGCKMRSQCDAPLDTPKASKARSRSAAKPSKPATTSRECSPRARRSPSSPPSRSSQAPSS